MVPIGYETIPAGSPESYSAVKKLSLQADGWTGGGMDGGMVGWLDRWLGGSVEG